MIPGRTFCKNENSISPNTSGKRDRITPMNMEIASAILLLLLFKAPNKGINIAGPTITPVINV